MNINKLHFMMSTCFNKSDPMEFGFTPTQEPNIYTLPSDGSKWEKRALYDLGWGSENGFVRLPVPDFDALIELLLHSNLEENQYGAAALLEDDKYASKLLALCQNIFEKEESAGEYVLLFKLLHLDIPLNRGNLNGKSHAEIVASHEAWIEIAHKVQPYINKHKRHWWRRILRKEIES